MRLAFFTLFLIAASAAFAAPLPCVDADAATYAQLDEGCTIGLFTLKNVEWGSLDPSPTNVHVAPEQVFIMPRLNSGQVEVSFRSDAFSVGSGQTMVGFLAYLIDPPPPILDDFSLTMNTNTPENGGSAIIDATFCAGDRLFLCTNGQLGEFTLQHFGVGNPNNILTNSVVFDTPVNTIDVVLRVALNGGPDPNGRSSITGATQTTMLLPEPGSAALALLGLGLLALRRRRRS